LINCKVDLIGEMGDTFWALAKSSVRTGPPQLRRRTSRHSFSQRLFLCALSLVMVRGEGSACAGRILRSGRSNPIPSPPLDWTLCVARKPPHSKVTIMNILSAIVRGSCSPTFLLSKSDQSNHSASSLFHHAALWPFSFSERGRILEAFANLDKNESIIIRSTNGLITWGVISSLDMEVA